MPWPRGPISWLASKSPTTRRRGLAMLASAVVAGGLARTAGSNGDSVALAATGGPMLLGNANSADATTSLTVSGNQAAFQATSGNGYGVVGASTVNGAAGVQGTSNDGYGVYGLSAAGPGVFGNSSNVGVSGLSTGNNGVNGASTTGKGVYGQSTSGPGLQGQSTNSYGVAGYSSNNIGVYGQSSGSFAVQGLSTSGIGLYGSSTTGNAVYGVSTGGNAAQFDGTVVVNGSFSATGIKSAIVKDSGGTYRRLYCLESPESYFEDFGRATLTGGSASINLEGVYSSTVDTSDYFVFLTELGQSTGLYVSSQTKTGFVVSSTVAGASTTFNYRIVAHRSDVDAPRFQKVESPINVPAPDTHNLENPPKPIAPPRIPDLPAGVPQPRSTARD